MRAWREEREARGSSADYGGEMAGKRSAVCGKAWGGHGNGECQGEEQGKKCSESSLVISIPLKYYQFL